MDYLLVATDQSGYTTVSPPVRKITHLLKLVDYLLVQEWLFHGLSDCTEDNPLAKPGGLSLEQADRRGFTTVCPTVRKTTHLLELVDYLLVQADRNSYTTVCLTVLKIPHLLKLVDYLLVQVDRSGYTTVCPPVRKLPHSLKLVDSVLAQAEGVVKPRFVLLYER